MWSRPLATLIFLSSVAFGQDLPGPGEPALTYADGSFTEPRGSQSTYRVGSTMNVSWDTTYDTSNLWLIIGWSFNSPIQLASNLGQTWYEWEVATDSTNSSEIYGFRVVNATGSTDSQKSGGFLSAAFLIDGLAVTSSSTATASATRISTSASAPVATTDAATTTSAGASVTSESGTSQSGLTQSGKIGLGVGVGVGAVGIAALVAGVILYRRSQNSKTQAGDNMEPYSQTPQTFPSTPQTYVGSPAPQPYEYYKPMGPSEMEATGRGAELDAGQGHGFTSEVYSEGGRPRPNQHAAELQG